MGNIVYYTTTILVLSVFVFIYLEKKFPYRKGLKLFREGFWVDLIWYTFVQSYFLQIIIFNWVLYPLRQHYLPNYNFVTDWPIVAQVLFFLVTHDLYIYWFHRWQHHSKILWKTHEAHHSNKEVDWLAGTRSHSVEILINQTIEYAPIILLGANPMVVPIKALIDAVWGMSIHSNINIKSGKLQYFINGPEMHQWHHADQREVFYSNYGTKFAIWDWMFGTAYLPDKKPLRFGLYYKFPRDYFLQHLYMFKKVDEDKLLENKAFKTYYELRPRIFKYFGLMKDDKGAVQEQEVLSEASPQLAEELK